MATRHRNTIRYLESTATTIAGVTDKAATGLFRWATTDHTGISTRLANMPDMGFVDTVKFILWQLLISIVASAVTAALVFILIAFVIPYLLFGNL